MSLAEPYFYGIAYLHFCYMATLIVTESEKVSIVSENIANLNKKGLYQ